MSPEIISQVNDELLLRMVHHFRNGKLISTELVGSQVNIYNGEWSGNFTFEYEFESGWNLANAALRKVGDNYEVIGINVYQTKSSQREINAFSLSSKSVLHYIVLILAAIVPLFIVTTIYVCAKTPISKWKWLWIIFILFGVGAIHLNWATGEYTIQLLRVYFLGVSAVAAGPYAPWVISVSFPLGAICFWFKRRHLIALTTQAKASTPPVTNTSTD